MTELENPPVDAEVIVAGGGMVGLSLALALDQAGLSVLVLDAAPPRTRLAAAYDGRASAIAFASFRMWRALGVADRMEGAYQRIEEILVTDGRVPDGLRKAGPSALNLHFDRRELNDAPDGEALGYMVENQTIRRVLEEAVAARPGIAVRSPVAVAGVRTAPGHAEAILGDGSVLRARLVVGCEGRQSMVRKAMGVRLIGWNYPQTAVVCTIAHEAAHAGVAHEYFLPSGPFALLPLPQNRMNIVWSEKRAAAEALMKLDEADFIAELKRRVGDFLGEVRLTGPRFSYPLSLQLAETMIGPRLALAGDAAHAVHPIAGQGLNMGLRDVAALAECIGDGVRVGLDPADFTVLERYQTWRRFDNVALALATEGFNRLFSNDWDRLRIARDIGMAAVGALGPARRFLMQEAGGGVGDLPRLLRGEALGV